MNRSDVYLLQKIRAYPCLTIILPTHRTAPGSRQDHLLLKNLIAEATNRLLGEFNKRDVEPLLKRLEDLAGSIDFNHSLDGLALFAPHGPIDPRTTPPAALASVFVPIDVLDVGPALVVQVNMPGVAAGDVSLSIKGDVLTVSGDIRPDVDYEGAVYLRRERRMAKLMRTIDLPMPIEAERAEASVANGVLTVTLPKIAAIVPKTIKVKTA